jgi:hypothetical protein
MPAGYAGSNQTVGSALVCVDDCIVALDLAEMLHGLGVECVSMCEDMAGAYASLRGSRFDVAFVDTGGRNKLREKLHATFSDLSTPVIYLDEGQGDEVGLRVSKPFSQSCIADCLSGIALLRQEPEDAR